MRKFLCYSIFFICLFILNCNFAYASDDIGLNYSDSTLKLNIIDSKYNLDSSYTFNYHNGVFYDGLWYRDVENRNDLMLKVYNYTDKDLIFNLNVGDITISNVMAVFIEGKFVFDNGEIKGSLVIQRKDYVDVVIRSNSNYVYGVSGSFKYDSKTYDFLSCVAKNDYKSYINNDQIIFENLVGRKNSIIGICSFKKINKNSINHNYKITFKDINISDVKKNIALKNISVGLKHPDSNVRDVLIANKVVNGYSGYNIKIILIVLFMFIVLLSIFVFYMIYKRRKHIKKYNIMKGIMSLFIFMLLFFPYLVMGDVDISYKDINNVVEIIFDNKQFNHNYLNNYDYDEDGKITVNDLVNLDIKYHTPKIKYDESVSLVKGYKYYNKVVKNINITSLNEVKNIKYCITTSDVCEPDTLYKVNYDNIVKTLNKNENDTNNNDNYQEISFDIEFRSNKDAQKICVFVDNDLGISNVLCDEKDYYVDTDKPSIKLKKNIVYVANGSNYDNKSNIDVNYGVSGGDIFCSSNKLVVGVNEVSCTVTFMNGLRDSIKYKLYLSNSYNNNVIFVGDSIVYGYLNNGYSFANYIGDNYDLKESVNAGYSGYFISNYDSNRWINMQINKYIDRDYDYVILQGGCNDIAKDVKIGSYVDDDFSGNYDTSTFLGGLEDYLYKAISAWPNSKFGYIITYQTPYNDKRNVLKSREYYNLMKKVLEKWNINYLDLFDGSVNGISYNTILQTNTYKYLPDTLHLNKEGYEVISSYIYDWMQGLEKYSR